MDKVFLEGIELFAWGGVTEAERSVGQRYSIDVILETDVSRSGRSDLLADTVNYARVYESVYRTIRARHFHVLESAATRVADSLLVEFGVSAVTVRLKKLLPPVDGTVAAAGVEIRRERHE